VQASAVAVHHPGGNGEPVVDQHRRPVADEHADGHAREAVPGREQPAGLVQGGADEPAVDDPRCRLVPLAERELRLVSVDALLGREGKVDAVRVVSAPPAGWVVMRRYAVFYRSPPRSKWAL
jgi:hypothetical protein